MCVLKQHRTGKKWFHTRPIDSSCFDEWTRRNRQEVKKKRRQSWTHVWGESEMFINFDIMIRFGHETLYNSIRLPRTKKGGRRREKNIDSQS